MKKLLFIFSLFSMIFLSNSSLIAKEKTVYVHNETETISQQNDIEDNSFIDLPEPEYKSTFIKMLFTLIGLIALIIITFWLFKRLIRTKVHQANSNKIIQVLEKRSISPKTMLYLIEVEGERIVIAESQLEVKAIKELRSESH